ncbi:MAG: hypothetical protein JSS20_21685 [Proteobacteria bacterium]|nr:hypothetical protein [Pseudomonadota bacterium]
MDLAKLCPLSEEDCAVLLIQSMQILEQLEIDQDEHPKRRSDSAVPRAILTYGDLPGLAGAIAVLVAHVYPDIVDADRLKVLAQSALLQSARGARN